MVNLANAKIADWVLSKSREKMPHTLRGPDNRVFLEDEAKEFLAENRVAPRRL